MHVISVSINYKQTSVEEREKVSFKREAIEDALHTLREEKSILEVVLLSTCNRTEVYAVTDQLHTGKFYTLNFLANHFHVTLDFIKEITEVRINEEAIRQLFHVTAGLNSMVLGETQILGQMRDAFLIAQAEGTTGAIFNKLFKEAITVAKRGHNETDISNNAISISYAAIELVKKVFSPLKKQRVVVIGAGDMALQSLMHLSAANVNDVTIINRTLENAAKLAGQFGYQCAPLEELDKHIRNANLVISSTARDGYVINRPMVERLMHTRRTPIVFMDIALPRDIEPTIDTIHNVYTYNVDDLSNIVDANLATRKEEAKKIERMIEVAISEYDEWVNMLGVVPVIQAMRTKALNIHDDTLDSLYRKIPDLSKRERTVVSKHMKSIINQMLKDPIIFTKDIANDKQRDAKIEDITQMFGIEDEVNAIIERDKERTEQEYARKRSIVSFDS